MTFYLYSSIKKGKKCKRDPGKVNSNFARIPRGVPVAVLHVVQKTRVGGIVRSFENARPGDDNSRKWHNTFIELLISVKEGVLLVRF